MSAFPKSRPLGFSLIELMVGVAIMAILLGLAMPNFQTWIRNSQIRNAAESVQNGLQKARAEAVTRNTNVEFVIGAGSSWVVKLPDVGGVAGAQIESRFSREGSRDVTVAVTPAGATTVTFNNVGTVGVPLNPPFNTDASAPFTRVDFAAIGGSQNLRVTIGAGGNARMCDPNAPASSTRAC